LRGDGVERAGVDAGGEEPFAMAFLAKMSAKAGASATRTAATVGLDWAMMCDLFRASCAVAAVGLLIAPLSAQRSSPGDFTVVPGQRFGAIRETTTRPDLVKMFSASAVTDGDVPIGEGFCTDGTFVLAGTRDAIDIAWQDAARTRVAFVRTRAAGGRWRTPKGVGIGTRLTELERIAGTVVTFSGFGWDYGGGTSWREGDGSLGLALEIDPADPQGRAADPDGRTIFGDREVRSDHPLIRAIRVHVAEMTQSWGQHLGEHDCARQRRGRVGVPSRKRPMRAGMH
jgi:hypothetical protein